MNMIQFAVEISLKEFNKENSINSRELNSSNMLKCLFKMIMKKEDKKKKKEKATQTEDNTWP